MTSESSDPGRPAATPATPASRDADGRAIDGRAIDAAKPRQFRRRFRLRRRQGADGGGIGSRPVVNDDPFPDDVLADSPPSVPVAPPGRPRSRGFYLLPNAFTTGCLFAGFYAVVMAMNDEFETAAIAIFVAMLLDTLDGRVARLTRTQSAFGEQYDSLADMVSFGLAPALIMYAWALKSLGKFGWVGAFIYCACAALRLARFNTNIGTVDKRYFQGLPSPAAAALVVGLVWVATDLRDSEWITATGRDLRWLAWVVTVYAGITMVSNVPFYSFKDLNLRRAVPFIFVLLLVAGFVLISSDPPTTLFTLFVIYGVSGYAVWLWRYWAGRPVQSIHQPAAVPPAPMPTAGSPAASAPASAPTTHQVSRESTTPPATSAASATASNPAPAAGLPPVAATPRSSSPGRDTTT